MQITILTLFPHFFESPLKESILKRAVEKGLVKINVVDIRNFAVDNYKTVDDRPYGGGVGMVMKADVLESAVKSQDKGRKIFLTPKGIPFDQNKALELKEEKHLILICGHYEGVDQRFIEESVDEEISIGDYVLTGGEIPALVVVDSVTRLIKGVLEKEEATKLETFQTISLEGKEVKVLEYPQYTKPQVWKGKEVPKILLSGHHQEIEKWRKEKSIEETKKKRPDLLK